MFINISYDANRVIIKLKTYSDYSDLSWALIAIHDLEDLYTTNNIFLGLKLIKSNKPSTAKYVLLTD